MTADSPVVETTRAEGATRINQNAVEGLPNNGRNFLSYMQLTPGVTIVQGPDGDMISVGGQKGIANNISVDGADFNNPFFGEQRGGQRPAFTFNQDAIKEMVVVSDGAAPEFGRSGGAFVQVVTKSGTNDLMGSANFFWKADELSSDYSNGEKYPFDQEQFGATLGGPLKQNRLFYFLAYDQQRFRQTKQTDPARIEQRVVDFFAALGSPSENGPIDRTNDARVFLGKVDAQLNPANLLTLRYNYTWSKQENGTFDVDSWGRSANGLEQGWSNAVSGSLEQHAVADHAQRVALPGGTRGSAPSVRGPGRHRAVARVPGHGLRLRQHVSVRAALLPAGRVPTTRASSSRTTCPGWSGATPSRQVPSSIA